MSPRRRRAELRTLGARPDSGAELRAIFVRALWLIRSTGRFARDVLLLFPFAQS